MMMKRYRRETHGIEKVEEVRIEEEGKRNEVGVRQGEKHGNMETWCSR